MPRRRKSRRPILERFMPIRASDFCNENRGDYFCDYPSPFAWPFMQKLRALGLGLVPAQDQWASAQVHNSMDPLQFAAAGAPGLFVNVGKGSRNYTTRARSWHIDMPRYNLRVPAARGNDLGYYLIVNPIRVMRAIDPKCFYPAALMAGSNPFCQASSVDESNAHCNECLSTTRLQGALFFKLYDALGRDHNGHIAPLKRELIEKS